MPGREREIRKRITHKNTRPRKRSGERGKETWRSTYVEASARGVLIFFLSTPPSLPLSSHSFHLFPWTSSFFFFRQALHFSYRFFASPSPLGEKQRILSFPQARALKRRRTVCKTPPPSLEFVSPHESKEKKEAATRRSDTRRQRRRFILRARARSPSSLFSLRCLLRDLLRARNVSLGPQDRIQEDPKTLQRSLFFFFF